MGLIFVIGALLFATVLISNLPWDSRIKKLIMVGLWLRVAGSMIYLNFAFNGGDYNTYFREGLVHADELSSQGIGAFLSSFEEKWWGTSLTCRFTGIVLSLLGPTKAGAFLVFAALSYVGIVGVALAFSREFSDVDSVPFIASVVLLPSLWFWPSAIGKDALIFCGIGIATYGFVGRFSRPSWLTMCFGIAVVFCIRPQVAATLVFAMVAGFWLSGGGKWTASRAIQGVLLLAAGVGVISLSGDAIGVDLRDADQLEGYFDKTAGVSTKGGSAIKGGIWWFPAINTLFRPFPWEASGISIILSAVEVIVIWGLAWYRRREIFAFVRGHRNSRLFWMAVIFIAVYSTAMGMAIGNIGIIARQRIHVLPFLLMMIFATPLRRPSTRMHA